MRPESCRILHHASRTTAGGDLLCRIPSSLRFTPFLKSYPKKTQNPNQIFPMGDGFGFCWFGTSVHNGLKTPVYTKPEDPRESSGLERKNNTIRSPAAARRRPVDRWCCFDVGAGGRTRTGTGSLPGDFKSPVSTVPPHRRVLLNLPLDALFVKARKRQAKNPLAFCFV